MHKSAKNEGAPLMNRKALCKMMGMYSVETCKNMHEVPAFSHA